MRVCCISPINTITACLDFLSLQRKSEVKFKHTLRKLWPKEKKIKNQKILIHKSKLRLLFHRPTIHFTTIIYKFISNLRRLTFLRLFFSAPSDQEEDVTLCMEPESATLTPPTQQGDASGGSSPGQPPAEPISERKASDVTAGLVQTLDEQDEEGPPASVANN